MVEHHTFHIRKSLMIKNFFLVSHTSKFDIHIFTLIFIFWTSNFIPVSHLHTPLQDYYNPNGVIIGERLSLSLPNSYPNILLFIFFSIIILFFSHKNQRTT